jgi:2-C-methyl-D-erythritol 4-phosphate cytidylyltransferase
MKEYVIIVAGGVGKRMNSNLPKQFLLLLGKPLIFYTIKKFYDYSPSIGIIIVLQETSINYWENLCKQYNFIIPHQTIVGGVERFYSVQNGLSLVPENSIVAIQDAVRPCASLTTISNCFKIAKEKGNAVPVVPIVDSLRKWEGEKNTALDRKNIFSVQTPQCFKTDLIKKAYQQNFSQSFTDDASVLENIGISINLTEGNKENIKVTSDSDLVVVETFLNKIMV